MALVHPTAIILLIIFFLETVSQPVNWPPDHQGSEKPRDFKSLSWYLVVISILDKCYWTCGLWKKGVWYRSWRLSMRSILQHLMLGTAVLLIPHNMFILVCFPWSCLVPWNFPRFTIIPAVNCLNFLHFYWCSESTESVHWYYRCYLLWYSIL